MQTLLDRIKYHVPNLQLPLCARLGITLETLRYQLRRKAPFDGISGELALMLEERAAIYMELATELRALPIIPAYLSDRQLLEIIPLHTRTEYRKSWLHHDARRALEAAGYASDGKGWLKNI